MAGFSVTISAVDKATAQIDKISASIGRITAPVTRLNAAVAKLGNVTGISRLRDSFVTLERQAVRTAGGFARLAPVLGTLTGAASIAGVARLVDSWSKFGQQQGQTAQRIDISVEKLSDMQGAARLAGSSAESMTDGLKGLQGTLHDAAGGRNAEAVVLFSKLHVAFRNTDGSVRNAAEAFPDLLAALSRIKDPQYRATASAIAFGSAAEGLQPVLRLTAEEFAAYERQARRYGGMTREGVAAAIAFEQSQTRLNLAIEGLSKKISERLDPVLGPLLDRLADFVASHGEAIAGFIGGIAEDFARWIDNGGVQDLLAKLDEFATKVDGIVKTIGGWTGAFEILLAFVAGKWVIGMLASIGRVAVALVGMRKLMSAGGLPTGLPGAVPGAAAGGGGALAMLGKVAVVATTAEIVHEVLSAIDPTDKLGQGIDGIVPGAAKFDDFMARHTGFGRTYSEQDAAAGRAPGTAAGGSRSGGADPAVIRPGEIGLPRGTSKGTTAFIQRYGALAQRIAEQTGTSALSVLAQLHLETGGSTNDHGNNPFNMQAGAGYRGKTVKRLDHHADGTPYMADFRVYDSLEQGAADYVALLKRRYKGALNTGDDTEAFARGLKAGGYAESNTYVKGVLDRRRQLGPAIPAPGASVPAPAPPQPGPPAPGLPPTGGGGGASGRISVDVTHRGDPGNTSVNVGTSGIAHHEGLRIDRTPLLAGVP